MNRKTNNVSLVLFLASALVALAAYGADRANVPIASNWLDWLADRIYAGLPLLQRLLPFGRMYLSASAVGLGFFLLATLIAAPFIGSTTNEGTLEKKLRSRAKKNQSSVKVG